MLTVADLMNQAYPQSGGHAVDGVIGMDPAALAGLLKLSGPITAPGWDGEINASNVEQIMYVDQYAAFGDRSGRVSFLGGVTKVIWDRLRTVSPSPIDMAKVLGPLAHNGHIKIWAADTKRESLFDRLSLSGAVAPIDGDYLAVVNANVGGNKMDAYLQREVTYDVSWDPATGTISADLTIKLNNNAPASGLPLYVTAKTDGTTEIAGENRMFVTVYTPWKVTSSKLDGVDFGANQQTEFGRTAISYYLTVLPSRSKVLHLTMTGSLAGQYRLDLHHQVTVHPDANSVNVHVPSGWVAHSVGLSTQGTAATATLVGNKDYRLSITASEPANSPGPWHKFREGRW